MRHRKTNTVVIFSWILSLNMVVWRDPKGPPLPRHTLPYLHYIALTQFSLVIRINPQPDNNPLLHLLIQRHKEPEVTWWQSQLLLWWSHCCVTWWKNGTLTYRMGTSVLMLLQILNTHLSLDTLSLEKWPPLLYSDVSPRKLYQRNQLYRRLWRTFQSTKWKGIYCPEWPQHLCEAQWLIVLFRHRPNREDVLKEMGSLTWWGWWDTDIREARWTHIAIRSQVSTMISMSRKIIIAARMALLHACSTGENQEPESRVCLPWWSKPVTSLKLWVVHPWYQNSGLACHQFGVSNIKNKGILNFCLLLCPLPLIIILIISTTPALPWLKDNM